MNKKYYSRKLRIISLSLSLFLGLVIVGLTVSWYVNNSLVSIKTGDNITIESKYPGLKFAINDSGNFASRQTYSPESGGYKLYDITGDGLNFLYPKYLEGNDQAPRSMAGYVEVDKDTENKESYFIEFKITFSTTEKLDIYLNNTSYVYPASLKKDENGAFVRDANGNLVWDQFSQTEGVDPNPSAYNKDLSNDWIAAAVRVAFIDVDSNGNETVKNIWVPNDKWQLIPTSIPTFKQNGDREVFVDTTLPYGYIKNIGNEATNIAYSETDYASNLISVGNESLADYNNNLLNNGVCLASFDGSTESPTEKSILIRIWFEGTDREANTVFNNGNIIYNFEFAAMSKKHGESDKRNYVYYDQSDGKLKYDTFNDELIYHGQEIAGQPVIHIINDGEFDYTINGIDWFSYEGTDLRKNTGTADFPVYKNPDYLAIHAAETNEAGIGSLKIMLDN